MESLEQLMMGFSVALSLTNLLFALIGCTLGTLIGVLPGIGPAAGTAILVPITFSMDTTAAIIMLAAIYYGCMYGGTITSVLINIPGESASVITCIEGYAMAKKGRAGTALGIAAIGSFIGGTVAVFGLVFLALPLSRLALKFGPAEHFSLLCLGLSLVMGLAGQSLARAAIMSIVGLLISMVGLDPVLGAPRFVFGINRLMDGIGFVPVVMGLFGIGEILISLETGSKKTSFQDSKITSFFPKRKEWPICVTSIIRGTGVGFFMGLIPGMNSVVPTFLSYILEKKISKYPEKFGTGVIEGVASPETANNAFANAALIPLFTLGIPSSPTVAILMGALILNGLVPGPMLFTQHSAFVWGVIASLYIGNVILLILNLPLASYWAKLLKIPYNTLIVIILIFCIVGAYSLSNSIFDIGIMLCCGILGYIFKKLEFPMAPAILTMVLGPMIERNLRETLSISRGDFTVFLTRPVSLVLLLVTALILIISVCKEFTLSSLRKEGTGSEI